MDQYPKTIHRFRKLRKSFVYALSGITYCLKTQQNAVIHLIATIAVCITASWLKVNASDWRWLVVCIGLVWFGELMNTAFEYVCDIVMPQFHISVKRAKDVAAGAVLVCTFSAIILGCLTFIPYL